MFGLVVLGLLAFLFIFSPEAAFIIFGGVLIALILLGIAAKIKRRAPASKKLILGLTVVLVFSGTFLTGWLISSRIASEMQVFARQLPQAGQEVLDALNKNLWFHQLMEEARQGNWLEDFIAPKIVPKTARLATITLNGVTAFGIAVFLGVYFAVDSRRYGRLLVNLAPKSQESRYTELFAALKDNLQNWLLGKLLSMIAVGVLTYIGLALLDVKAAFPLAFIAGFLGFIPNIGPILSAVPAMIIGFSQGWKMSVYVAVLYMAVQAAEGLLITPLIQKKKVKLLPAGLISFQFVMAALFGFGGLFMATPLLVAVMTTIQKFWVENPRR